LETLLGRPLEVEVRDSIEKAMKILKTEDVKRRHPPGDQAPPLPREALGERKRKIREARKRRRREAKRHVTR